jgi:hypothetical protein
MMKVAIFFNLLKKEEVEADCISISVSQIGWNIFFDTCDDCELDFEDVVVVVVVVEAEEVSAKVDVVVEVGGGLIKGGVKGDEDAIALHPVQILF